MPATDLGTLNIFVRRDGTGAYIARCCKRQTSCTAGPRAAAERLAAAIFQRPASALVIVMAAERADGLGLYYASLAAGLADSLVAIGNPAAGGPNDPSAFVGMFARGPAPLSPMEPTAPVSVISLRLAADLPDHPLLAHIPVWAPHEPEFQSLKASILERGVDYPVLIDSAGRVVDGRNRRNACASAGVPVPVRHVPDDHVAGTIVSALGNRRHVSKGAMAYLLAPLLKPAIEETRARQNANLRAGVSERSLSELSGRKTIEEMADGLGFGRTVFFQALKIHEKFAENPELRTQFEEQILSGELGLGGAIQAIAGKLATEDKPRVVRPPDELVIRAFTDLRNRWDGYSKLTDAKRDEVKALVVAAAPEWPADLAAATAAAWRKAGLIS